MIAVTGVTGGVGGAALQTLIQSGRRAPLAAVGRRLDRLGPDNHHLHRREANYDDPASLRRAFNDVDTLVFVSSDGHSDTMRRHHANVLAAAIRAGVRRVISTSIVDIASDSRFYYTPVHRETEQQLSEAPIGHSIARTAMFSEFFAHQWGSQAVAAGELVLPAGDGAVSFVSRADVGAGLAALALLEEPPDLVELTGPVALGLDEVAGLLSEISGRRIRYRPVDDDLYRERLWERGAERWLIEAFASMWRSVAEGRFAKVCPDLGRLTGSAPRHLPAILERALGASHGSP